jgi:deoxyinosine 3'endonuclease (endonuclease V)
LLRHNSIAAADQKLFLEITEIIARTGKSAHEAAEQLVALGKVIEIGKPASTTKRLAERYRAAEKARRLADWYREEGRRSAQSDPDAAAASPMS